MRNKIILIVLLALVICILSLSMGTVYISPLKIIRMLCDNYSGDDSLIVFAVRLPRLGMALLIGASLAVSGAVFQAILKNPLANSFTTGVSSGASLGAAVCIILMLNGFFIAIGALCGGLLTAYFVYIISLRKKFGTTALILSGIALGFIFWAMVLLLFALSPAHEVHKAMLWLMGDLSIARYTMLPRALPLGLLLIFLTYRYYRTLDVITFGEQFSHALGVSLSDIRALFWLATMLASLSVALAGVIGFIGLIIPHIVRVLFRAEHKVVLGVSAVCGALFLVLCDIVSRTVFPPYEIPIGIITNLVGGVFFISLIFKKRKTI